MDRERLTNGVMVAYFDLSQYPVGAVRQAVATGPEILDPDTDEPWLPVRRPDQVLDLVRAALIVDVVQGPPWEG
jgi:hypothetical protein